MDDFVIETDKAFLDCGVDCIRGGEGESGIGQGGFIGAVQLARDEGDEDLAEFCGCCPSAGGGVSMVPWLGRNEPTYL